MRRKRLLGGILGIVAASLTWGATSNLDAEVAPGLRSRDAFLETLEALARKDPDPKLSRALRRVREELEELLLDGELRKLFLRAVRSTKGLTGRRKRAVSAARRALESRGFLDEARDKKLRAATRYLAKHPELFVRVGEEAEQAKVLFQALRLEAQMRACVATQKIFNGAVEMMRLDRGKTPRGTPESLLEKFVEEGYLSPGTKLTCPVTGEIHSPGKDGLYVCRHHGPWKEARVPDSPLTPEERARLAAANTYFQVVTGKAGSSGKSQGASSRGSSQAPESREVPAETAERRDPQAQFELGKRLRFETVPPDYENWREGQRLLVEAANQGHVEAAFVLGNPHYRSPNGEGSTNLNPRRYLEQAAEAGHITAGYVQGVLLLRDYRGESDRRRGFEKIQKAAEAGFPMAMALLARCFEKGVGVAPSPEAAADWHRKARDAGLSQRVALPGEEREYGVRSPFYRIFPTQATPENYQLHQRNREMIRKRKPPPIPEHMRRR